MTELSDECEMQQDTLRHSQAVHACHMLVFCDVPDIHLVVALLVLVVTASQNLTAAEGDYCSQDADLDTISFDGCSSCGSGCGQRMNLYNPREYCSCDQLCVFYADCCWDFQKECEDVYQDAMELQPYLPSVKPTCNNTNVHIVGTVIHWSVDLLMVDTCPGVPGIPCPVVDLGT